METESQAEGSCLASGLIPGSGLFLLILVGRGAVYGSARAHSICSPRNNGSPWLRKELRAASVPLTLGRNSLSYLYHCLHTSPGEPLTAPGPAALLWGCLAVQASVQPPSGPQNLGPCSPLCPQDKPAACHPHQPQRVKRHHLNKVPINSQQSG